MHKFKVLDHVEVNTYEVDGKIRLIEGQITGLSEHDESLYLVKLRNGYFNGYTFTDVDYFSEDELTLG